MKQWTRYLPAALIGLILFSAVAVAGDNATREHAARLLHEFAEDYRDDITATESETFAVRITDVGEWHVQVKGRGDSDARADVTLHEGLPEKPALVYITDFETLRRSVLMMFGEGA